MNYVGGQQVLIHLKCIFNTSQICYLVSLWAGEGAQPVSAGNMGDFERVKKC